MHPHINLWLCASFAKTSHRKIFDYIKTESMQKLFALSKEACLNIGFNVCFQNLLQLYRREVQAAVAWCDAKKNQHIVCFEDDRYPELLKQIAHPPLLLYVKGNAHALQSSQLAVVGARKASFQGAQNAEDFSYVLAKNGFTITSGLAHGIDTHAHLGALRAKGCTIAVAGCGLHTIYPLQNKSLANDIVSSDGAIVSEFPLGSPPRAQNFPIRNRIIIGLSLGVLIVEAAIKSGSLISARLALEANRDVFAIPGSIHEPLSKGTHHLIKQGAKLTEDVRDILDEINSFAPQKIIAPIKKNELHLSNSHAQVLQCINYELTLLDVILSRSGLTADELSSILLSLEINGYIKNVWGGYVRIAKGG